MHRGTARPTTNTATMKRIQREIRDTAKEDLGDIKLAPSDASIFNWTAAVPGPEGSVYEGGVFKLSITLPADYPFSAPRVTFDTRIYHMNISSAGAICIDVLKSQWSPALSLFKVMLSLSSLLTDPNPSDPLVPGIASEYTKNRAQHDATAREWTRLYATPPKPSSPPPSNKGKGRATAPVPALSPAASNPNSARATPNPGSITRRAPDIIELSSDVEEDTTRGRMLAPIEVDDDDNSAPRLILPPQPSTTRANGKRKHSDQVQPVAGSTASGSTPAANGSGRATRSSKRRAGKAPSGETIVID
ncbi:hypothetical protein FRB94_008883 [Tulasnella sp. JGI-2019a]|nr:hypothetical protein FRB94_008883 [Tulasnella sp. JGI-2019a]KAG9000773.1 hypothetical protein FRB93_012599 [Tulasnella sp. JGI-2019a]KAG9030312.1 hypothetical protein FRB95_004144 [Tulasnella sp. JGI-2019a]